MTNRSPESSMLIWARIAGVLYLVIILIGVLSEVVVRQGIIVPGDAAATAARITAAPGIVRLGVVGDLVVFLCDVAVAVLLYMLLRPVSRTLSLMAAAFRITGTAIYGLNLLYQFAALHILSGSSYLGAFDADQLQALALFFLDLHGHGYDLGLVFFGLNCLVLGWLLVKSDAFPGILGVLMVLAGGAYLVGSFTLFLFPAHVEAVQPVYALSLAGEVALAIWLTVRGVRRAPHAEARS